MRLATVVERAAPTPRRSGGLCPVAPSDTCLLKMRCGAAPDARPVAPPGCWSTLCKKDDPTRDCHATGLQHLHHSVNHREREYFSRGPRCTTKRRSDRLVCHFWSRKSSRSWGRSDKWYTLTSSAPRGESRPACVSAVDIKVIELERFAIRTGHAAAYGDA